MTVKWVDIPFEMVLAEPLRNGIYKPKQFHGLGAKMVNMGELFAYPRLRNVPMRRVELTETETHRFGLRTGDLIFARRSLVAEGAGKCSIVLDAPEPTAFESSIIRARPDATKANPLFLYYYFNSPAGLHGLDSIRRHVAVAGITGKDLASLVVPLPPLLQQQAIAHILGTLDDKIELNRRIIDTLETMARALFRSWFVDFEPVRAEVEARLSPLSRQVSELFPSRLVETAIGRLPAGWEVSEIGKEVTAVGGATPSTKEPAFWDRGVHAWTTPKDLSTLSSLPLLRTARRITDVGLERISSGLLPVGTVLLSSRAPIGYLAITEVPTAVNQGFIAMICRERLSNLYVLFWSMCNLHNIRAIAGGSTFAEISKKTFRPMPVIVPPTAILDAFDKVVRPIYERIVCNVREIEILEQTRDLLLPRLVSGAIQPDPRLEPPL